jgi:hypothetical protein
MCGVFQFFPKTMHNHAKHPLNSFLSRTLEVDAVNVEECGDREEYKPLFPGMVLCEVQQNVQFVAKHFMNRNQNMKSECNVE